MDANQSIDLEAHKGRTKQLIARLKGEIGDRYGEFKAQSLAYQRGNINVSQYYASAVSLVSNEKTLRQAFDLLPDPQKRTAVLQVCDAHSHHTFQNAYVSCLKGKESALGAQQGFTATATPKEREDPTAGW
eukprot:1186095-Pyramimonas_sp.AAC.1